MNLEEILDMLDELLDSSWNVPLSGGRCVVDADKVRDLLDDIRLNMPTEIKQAKAIVADRTEIISVAKKEAETIVRKAEDRARALISQEEILRQAQGRATEIITQAQSKSREMRQAAQEFSDRMLKQTEDSLTQSLGEVKSTRQALRGVQRQLMHQQNQRAAAPQAPAQVPHSEESQQR